MVSASTWRFVVDDDEDPLLLLAGGDDDEEDIVFWFIALANAELLLLFPKWLLRLRALVAPRRGGNAEFDALLELSDGTELRRGWLLFVFGA